jgi:hypothetical protein
LAAIVEGASSVREYHGIYTNVLTYKRRCDACGYLAPTNSTIVSLLAQDTFYEDDSYEAEGFSCPDCTTYQAVRIQLERGQEAIYQKD